MDAASSLVPHGRKAPPAPRFRATPFAQIQPNLEEEWLVDDLMPAQGLMFVYGNPEAGKSFLVLDACLHVASGREWAGKEVKQGGIFYVAAEGGTGFAKRVAAARFGHKFRSDTPFAQITEAPNLGTMDGDAKILLGALREQLPIIGGRCRLVVLDTLAKVTTGSEENSAKEMGVLIRNAEEIARTLQCLVLIVHHDGKDSDRGMRGSIALRGGCDAIWKVAVEDGQRSVTVERMKEGASGMSWQFGLVSLEVGTSSAGKPVTSCFVEISGGVQQSATVKAGKRPALSAANAAMLQAIEKAIFESPRTPPASNEIPVGVRATTRRIIADYADNLGVCESDNAKSTLVMRRRAFTNLIGLKRIGSWKAGPEEWVWLK
jgi:hypothetical protein